MTQLAILDDCYDLRSLEEVLRTAASRRQQTQTRFNALMSDLHGADRIARHADFTDSVALVARFAAAHPRIAHHAEKANLATCPRFVAAILRVSDL